MVTWALFFIILLLLEKKQKNFAPQFFD